MPPKSSIKFSCSKNKEINVTFTRKVQSVHILLENHDLGQSFDGTFEFSDENTAILAFNSLVLNVIHFTQTGVHSQSVLLLSHSQWVTEVLHMTSNHPQVVYYHTSDPLHSVFSVSLSADKKTRIQMEKSQKQIKKLKTQVQDQIQLTTNLSKLAAVETSLLESDFLQNRFQIPSELDLYARIAPKDTIPCFIHGIDDTDLLCIFDKKLPTTTVPSSKIQPNQSKSVSNIPPEPSPSLSPRNNRDPTTYVYIFPSNLQISETQPVHFPLLSFSHSIKPLLSHHNTLLVVSNENQNGISIYFTRSGVPKSIFRFSSFCSFCLSNDSSFIAIGSFAKIDVYSFPGFKPICSLSTSSESLVDSIAFHPNDKSIFYGLRKGYIGQVYLNGKTSSFESYISSKPIKQLCCTSTHIYCSFLSTLVMFNITTKKIEKHYFHHGQQESTHQSNTLCLDFRVLLDYIIALYDDHSFRFFHKSTGEMMKEFRDATLSLRCFTLFQNSLYTGFGGGIIRSYR